MSRSHRVPESGLLGTVIWFYSIISLILEWSLHGIRPVVLGGVPRRSFFHSGSIDFRDLSLVRQLVASDELKGVVDSVWDMDDVVKVCPRVIQVTHPTSYKYTRLHQETASDIAQANRMTCDRLSNI